MPLPFLTADRPFDDVETVSRADAPLPYEELDRWRRPYRPGPWRVGGAALVLLFAAYLLFGALIMAMAGALPGAGACVAAGALVIVFAVRLLRVGAWVSARGLRRIGLFTTTTLPWEHVAAVRTVQQPVKWLGLPRTVQGQALVVATAAGEPPRPLLTDHNADFLGRAEAFDMAADSVEGWAADHAVAPARS
ncbi:hypothetical protein [Streptomyces sp. URMC 123]|uniref:hypothetical protein n=1 Tax=Streptomyces sp. URMC 123 TaxID=3423403 RepID=UPI003F1BE7D4